MIETIATDINHDTLPVPRADWRLVSEKLRAYLELTKPRITFEVSLITFYGFLLGSPGSLSLPLLFHTLLAVGLLSSGISTLNQYLESEGDGLMRRTAFRPVPSGKISPMEAMIFGLVLTIGAELYLAIKVNPLTSWLGFFTAVGYVFCYTPLKTKTTLSTFVGAFPGAMPPLVGWAAATGHLTPAAWALFAIMFFWQYPHFLAIAWMYREDYQRADIKMLPVVEPDGRKTKLRMLVNAVILLPLSLAPTYFGLSGWIYTAVALVLGVMFLRSVLVLNRSGSIQDARKVLKTSIIYISILFLMMVVDKV